MECFVGGMLLGASGWSSRLSGRLRRGGCLCRWFCFLGTVKKEQGCIFFSQHRMGRIRDGNGVYASDTFTLSTGRDASAGGGRKGRYLLCQVGRNRSYPDHLTAHFLPTLLKSLRVGLPFSRHHHRRRRCRRCLRQCVPVGDAAETKLYSDCLLMPRPVEDVQRVSARPPVWASSTFLYAWPATLPVYAERQRR
ncbi:hypothetical protein LX32DRAFT_397613 [Colletotrichum zoysiae]|uniref:Uncharacterized protein n=1 Tax=Colletotrichum zoysiae TaxID=1216348 RepID=A0AAD9HV43_9PEZI|nr:hypothetical protein LX32DRAFT_397613 [Colletotrichum zoysiae]